MLPAGAVGLRVLSLFDGMSCGQQALERSGVNVLEYYASEIDKHAIAVTQHNYPNTMQLGSVINVDGYNLPKIDLLIGGSPCQSFSFAGKRKGMSTKCETEILTLEHYLQLKNEGYEFEGQSYLFWEYMRLLNEVKPKYFLLENVMMGEKWERVLSKAIGVKPIEINSALVSAQNRRRLYWTNIGMQPMGLFGDMATIIKQPKDKGILLKDILESEVESKYFISDTMISRISRTNNGERCFTNADKALFLAAAYYKQGRDNQLVTVDNTMPRSSTTGKGGTGPLSRTDGKTYCLDTGQTNAIEIKCVAIRGRGENNEQTLEERKDCKTNTLTSVFKDNLVKTACIKFGRTDEAKAIRKESMANGKDYTPFQAKEITGLDFEKMNTLTTVTSKDNLVMQLNPSTESNGCQPYQQNRVYDTDGISPALMAQMSCGTHAILENKTRIRRLTPIECERLQTVKDGFTSIASDSQRYRMLGNGWTVDVIAHILSYGEWL
jgi:DNA (cytosine-5)-methyltransferase 3A